MVAEDGKRDALLAEPANEPVRLIRLPTSVDVIAEKDEPALAWTAPSSTRLLVAELGQQCMQLIERTVHIADDVK